MSIAVRTFQIKYTEALSLPAPLLRAFNTLMCILDFSEGVKHEAILMFTRRWNSSFFSQPRPKWDIPGNCGLNILGNGRV